MDTYYVCIRKNNRFMCKEFDTLGKASVYTVIFDTILYSDSMLISMYKFTPHFIRKFLIKRALTNNFIKFKIE